MSTFTELVKKRRQSGGTVGGSLSYGLKERVKETFDPRRIFKQDGLLTALFPKLRAYKSGKVNSIRQTIPKLDAPEISMTEPLLESIRDNTKISAKNSMVLPAIHRDINVMRQNIIKLVKLKGGNSTNKADMWFMKSSTMEAAYENKMSNKGKVDKKPTPEKKEEKEDDSGFIKQILETISGVVKPILGTIASLSGAVLKIVGGLALVTGIAMTVGRVLFSIIRFFTRGKGAILGIGAALVGIGAVSSFMDKFDGLGKQMEDYQNGIDSAMSTLGDLSGQTNTQIPGTTPQAATNETPKKETSNAEYASRGMKALGVSQDTGNKLIGGAGVLNAAATYKAGSKLTQVSKTIGDKVLDARTMSSGYLKQSAEHKIAGGIVKSGEKLGAAATKRAVAVAAKDALTGKAKTSLWGKFLEFVARKSPTLFARIGLKLAQSATLMSIPIFGWIGAALNLGFTLWTAWELYELWREFNKIEEGENAADKSKTPSIEPTQSSAPASSATPVGNDKTSIDGVKGATDKRQANAVNSAQSDRQIYDSEDFKKWQEEQGAGWLHKGIYDPTYGVDAYKKVKGITGTPKQTGNKVSDASEKVRAQQRANQRPQVNVAKTTNTKSVPTKTSNQNVEIASVYDAEFLKLLGMSSDMNGIGAT